MSCIKEASSEKEIIHSTSVAKKNYYTHFKKTISFVKENGEKVEGLFESNHTILDNLQGSSVHYDNDSRYVCHLKLHGDYGEMGFGFYRKDIVFTLYNRQFPSGISVQDVHELPPEFNVSKPTKFITHGWLSSGTSQICQSIKNELLKQFDVNVFIVDWSPIADIYIYPIPAAATRVVAIFFADFVNELIEIGVSHENLHLIGHSLGAHVSGFTGRRIAGGKVARITGLDPALPFFDLMPNDHLNQNDSHFVDVIHTCAGFLGIKEPIGHVDFYPNGGGPPQPGCFTDWQTLESCSHGKSYKLFADSINNEKPLIAMTSIGQENCSPVKMGVHTPHTIRGVFFLNTN